MIFLSSVMVNIGLSFILYLLTGVPLSNQIYIFIGNGFLPIAFCCWIVAFTDLKYERNKNTIRIIAILPTLIYELFFLFIVFTNPSSLGELISPTDNKYSPFVYIFQLLACTFFFITGLLIGKESLKSDLPKIKLKGKFLIIAFILFYSGTVLEAISQFLLILLVFGRVILIISTICFYIGFILPEKIEKIFIKE